jgi:hypothetical protein
MRHMGMFDSYIPVPDLPCPGCGKALREWQGKDGPCALFVWRQGTKSPVDQTADDDAKLPPDRLALWRLPSRFVIYCYCACGRRSDAEGKCDAETWSGTRVTVSAG